jgi:hypothetical protein
MSSGRPRNYRGRREGKPAYRAQVRQRSEMVATESSYIGSMVHAKRRRFESSGRTGCQPDAGRGEKRRRATITNSDRHTRLPCEGQAFFHGASSSSSKGTQKKVDPKESCRDKTVLHLCVRTQGSIIMRPAHLLAWHELFGTARSGGPTRRYGRISNR